uniref:hypothetical protein n=1 Tax=Staphylococcus haemolyticus TaxID=1283 RepID=UPI001C92EB51
IKPPTKLSTNTHPIKPFTQPPKKTNLKQSQINQQLPQQKIPPIYNKQNKQQKPKHKKSIHIHFFLPKK